MVVNSLNSSTSNFGHFLATKRCWMEARDFTSIGRAAQEELRRRALVLIEQNGMSQAEAARAGGHEAPSASTQASICHSCRR